MDDAYLLFPNTRVHALLTYRSSSWFVCLLQCMTLFLSLSHTHTHTHTHTHMRLEVLCLRHHAWALYLVSAPSSAWPPVQMLPRRPLHPHRPLFPELLYTEQTQTLYVNPAGNGAHLNHVPRVRFPVLARSSSHALLLAHTPLCTHPARSLVAHPHFASLLRCAIRISLSSVQMRENIKFRYA